MGIYTRIDNGEEINNSWIGGILIFSTGLLSIIIGLGLLGVQNVHIFVVIAFLISGFGMVLGGVSAMMQKYWYLSIIGCIVGLFSPGIPFSVLSVLGLIIIVGSKKEFYRHVSMHDRRQL